MTKLEFILALNERLSGLPADDIRERLNFYSEMIEDRVEEGISEEDAVAAVGSVDAIAAQIKSEFSPTRETEKPEKRRRGVWTVALLVLGSPVWLPLLISAAAIVVSLYAVIWSAIVSLWSVFASLAAVALCGLVAGAAYAAYESVLSGVAMIGVGLVLAGFAILFFFVCRAATSGISRLTVIFARWIRKCFSKREAV